MKENPPKWPLRFLRWFCREDFLEEIEGDLTELFFRQYEHSPAKSKRLFTWQVLRHLRPEFIKSIRLNTHYNNTAMIQHYSKTAWRNLTRGKSFSLINISGLAIGMAGAILILLWLQNEISFDKFHANKDNLYQVYGLGNNTDGHATTIDVTSQPLAPRLKQDYPEVEAAARLEDVSSLLITANNKSFTTIKGGFTDASFLQLFSFPLIEGNGNDQLKNVYSITITQKLAQKLFGNENALGKTLRIDSVDNFTVTGVLKDLPSNTRFDFEYLLSWDYFRKIGWNNDSWINNSTPTYILLAPHTNASAFNEKIKNITRVNAGRNDL